MTSQEYMERLREEGAAGIGWFNHRGVRYTLKTSRRNTIPVQTALHILLLEGWTDVEYYTTLRLYRARNPEGQFVDMSVDTVRWTALHIVYCEMKKTKSSLDNPQPV